MLWFLLFLLALGFVLRIGETAEEKAQYEEGFNKRFPGLNDWARKQQERRAELESKK
jgi:hypothetical protein